MDMHDFLPLVGVWSEPVKNEVEKGAIRKFAQAIGDDNPLYSNEEAAKKSRYGRLVAPPTFSRTFDYGRIPNLVLPTAGLIHGEQSYVFHRPILAGDVLYASQALVDVKERSGKLGRMIILLFSYKVENEAGDLVQTATSTIIYRPEGGNSHD
nr:MaoC family dehydratase N-terminal domain-containing protein [Alicyclobacillus hesperidum]